MPRVSGPEPGRGAPGAPGALRRLHDRHAERLRTAARWLGFEDEEEREAAVTHCFVALGEAVPEDSAVGWAALMRALARAEPPGTSIHPRSGAEAALLGFLGRCARPERAVFALAELGGFDAAQLARAIGAPPAAGQALIVGLRRAFAADPAVGACGGPGAVLSRCVAEDRPPPGWRAASLGVLLDMSKGAGEPEIPRAALVGVGALALAVLLTLWPGPAAPPEPPEVDATPIVVPVAEVPVVPVVPAVPVVVGEPKDMSKKTGSKGQAVVVRKKGPGGRSQAKKKEALARRAEEAAGRDPGAVIVELEMLGAARKALKTHPGQALAYADQHRREYPNSQLVDHNAEVRVRALCALKRTAEAQAEAQRRPAAKVQTALREACGG